MDNSEQLIEEVRQFYDQYRQEIPADRRAWPVSIKNRVFQLSQLDMSFREISKRTGIPVTTIYSWRAKSKQAKSGFLPVRVVEHESQVQTSNNVQFQPKSTTVTVVLSDGIRIECGEPRTAVELIKGMRS